MQPLLDLVRHRQLSKIAPAVRQAVFDQLYGPLAPSYDRFVGWLFLGEWERWQRTVLLDLPEDGLVVELGFGTGTLAAAATAASSSRPWLAIEPSGPMLRAARHAHHRRSWWLVRATAGQLPIPDHVVAAVVATFPGPWIAASITAGEIERVLRPSGLLLVVLSGELAPGGWRRRWRRTALRTFYGRDRSSTPPPVFDLPGFAGETKIVATKHGSAMVYIARPISLLNLAVSQPEG